MVAPSVRRAGARSRKAQTSSASSLDVPHVAARALSRSDNASWSRPEGAASDASGRGSHPAVHLSHADADAFCAWAMPGGRLPSEVEWERAARGGKEGRTYAWGNKLKPRNEYRANIWQGQFPLKNTARDGFKWAAPVDAFGPQNK